MMETFTQIIFPPLPKVEVVKKVLALPPARRNALEFWFKDIIDHTINHTRLIVMIKCPECNYVYEFQEIQPTHRDIMRECLQTNQMYYKASASKECPRCGGNPEYDGKGNVI
jgi:hypothetical protein